MSELLQEAVIRKERVSDQIRAVLKQAILDGHFKPGDKFLRKWRSRPNTG